MVDVNSVVLLGRLTRDAELKYTAGGQAVCKFSIAVNRRKKNGDQWEDEANFFDIVLWGKQGESLNQYLKKGKMVAVDGELRQDRWQQDGQNRSKVEVVADFVQLLGGGNANGESGSGSSSGGRSSSRQPATESDDDGGSGGNNGEFQDDIPF
jgi:single-strand DNA-binding protein